jgi:CRISPR-associated protein Cas1
MQLIVDQRGCFIGKKSERLRVTFKGETLNETPLFNLENVLIVAGGVSISADAIEACTVAGIPIDFVDWRGSPYATVISSELTGTVQTRRAQLKAYDDARGVELAKAFAGGKLENMAQLVRYSAKYRKTTDPETHDYAQEAYRAIMDHVIEIQKLDGPNVDAIRFQLLSAEGRGSQRYWDAMGHLLLAEVDWPGRRTEGATDLVNSLLNYGYGILRTQVQRALILAGLDPFGGFIHVDRPGKHALVFDLMEEFRQMVVDRTVFAMLNQGMKLQLDDEGRLDDDTRRALAERLTKRLDGQEPYAGKQHQLRAIIQMQARHIATFVRGVGPYAPFVGRW